MKPEFTLEAFFLTSRYKFFLWGKMLCFDFFFFDYSNRFCGVGILSNESYYNIAFIGKYLLG